MSESQTAANAISIAGALRSGIFAGAEAVGGSLGLVGYGFETGGAIAFGLGDGLAVQDLGEGFTGAVAAEAAAIATPGVIAAAAAAIVGAPVEVPAAITGAAVVSASLLADYGAKFIYDYLQQNGDEILAAAGQSDLDQAQAQMAMAQAISDGITSAANTISSQITSLATQIGQLQLDGANADLAASQAIQSWFGEAINSLGTTLSGIFQSIGGSQANRSSIMDDFNTQTSADASSLFGWLSGLAASPPVPSNPDAGNPFSDSQFVSQFQQSFGGLDPSASDAALTAVATLAGTPQTLASGVAIDPLADGNTNLDIQDPQAGGFDTFTTTDGQAIGETVSNAIGQTIQQETTSGTYGLVFQAFSPSTGASEGSVTVTDLPGDNPTTSVTISNSTSGTQNTVLSGLAAILTYPPDDAPPSPPGGSGPVIEIGGDGASLAGGSGQNLLIDLGTDGTVTGGSGSNQIFLGGPGDAADASGAAITVGSGLQVTIAGTDNAVQALTGSTVDVTQSGNVLDISNSTINVGDGLSITIDGTGNQVNLGTSSSLSLSGGDDTIGLGGNNYISLTGDGSDIVNNDVAGDTVDTDTSATINGTGGLIDVSGSGFTVTASGETIDAASGTSFNTAGGDDSINLAGSGGYLGLLGGSGYSITGTNDTLATSGLFNALN